jgi:hypothetical protein
MAEKCDNNGAYCRVLEHLIQDYHSKGIVDITVVNLSGDSKHLGVAYKEDKKSRGIMFNYCPFCGEKISKGF